MALDPQENLIVRVSGVKGGGSGQLILNDVEFNGTRDNSIYHGIGNDDPQDVSPGNKEYTMDLETIANERTFDMTAQVIEGDASVEDAEIRSVNDNGTVVDRVTIGGFVWNDFAYAASDGGDYTISITADCYDVNFSDN